MFQWANKNYRLWHSALVRYHTEGKQFLSLLSLTRRDNKRWAVQVPWLSQGWLQNVSLSFLTIATFFTSGQRMNIYWLPLYCTCLSCWLYIAIWDLMLIWNQSVQGFCGLYLFVYVVIKRGGWDTINQYDPATFLHLSHIGIVIVLSVFCIGDL